MIEDCERDAVLIEHELRRRFPDLRLQRVFDAPEFRAAIQSNEWDVVISDHNTPTFTSFDALSAVRESDLQIPVIVLTGIDDERDAVKALEGGAADYLHKDRLARLPFSVQRALRDQTIDHERRKALRELERTAKSLRGIIETTPECIKILETNGTIFDMNPAGLELLKMDRERVIGKPITRFVHPEDRAAFLAFQGRVLQGNGGPFEFRVQSSAGQILWMESRAVILKEDEGGEIRLLAVTRDISEQREAEAILKRRQRLFQSIFSSIAEGIIVQDSEGHIVEMNEKGRELFEFAGVAPRNWGELVELFSDETGKSPGANDDPLARTASTGVSCRNVLFVVASPQEIRRWISLNTEPIEFDPENNRWSVVGSFRDVTKRMRACLEVKFQASMINQANDAILVQTENGLVQFWNRSAERIYGWSAAEAIGLPARQLLFRGADEYIAALEKVQQDGLWTGEIQTTTRDGKIRLVRSSWTRIETSTGERGILIINADVSEQKELESQLLRTQRVQSLGALAGGIAHDLNNVLAPILLSASIIAEGESRPEVLEFVKTIERSAERGADLVRHLLRFARGTKTRRGVVQTRVLIAEVLAMCRVTFPKNIKIEIEVADNCPAIHGDITELEQLILNLIVNARDAMPTGGVLRIRASDGIEAAASIQPTVRLEISDSGTGIPKEIISQIFEPFFTTKEPGEGTGLGLFTVRQIVTNHGGRLQVRSTRGFGTTFDLSLPGIRDSNLMASQKVRQTIGPQTMRVLVIDDEIEVCETLRKALERHGCQVATATNPLDALSRFAGQIPATHLVITDLMMPQLDGLTLAKILKMINPSIHIVASSGTLNEEVKRQFAGAGVDRFLEKPFRAEDLLQTLAALPESSENGVSV